MKQLLLNPVVLVVLGLGVFNALVQGLEKPTDKDGRGYRYLYRTAHLLAFNFQYALTKKFPDYIPPQGKDDQ